MNLNYNNDHIRNINFSDQLENDFCNQLYGGKYGWFYFVWIALLAITLFLLIRFFAKKHNSKINDKILFITGVVLLIFEINKQILAYVKLGHYVWNYFPFQFCSTPMWIMIVAPLIKEGKIKDAMLKFLSLFGVIAALSAIILPEGLYWTYFGMTCHSFFWHISMLLVGVYLIVANGYCKSIKTIFKETIPATIVFSSLAFIALILNEVSYIFIKDMCITYEESGILKQTFQEGYKFNMFYISRHFISSLPVFKNLQISIQGLLPNSEIINDANIFGYSMFLLLYLVAFMLGGIIIWFLSFAIRKLINCFKYKFKNA